MADGKVSIDYVLKNFEDQSMQGKVTPDEGGLARFGINSRFHPELVEKGYFDEEKVPHDQALTLADQTYEEQYVTPLRLNDIVDQAVANKVLDMAINMGVVEAAKLLQRSCTLCKHTVIEDNIIGDSTIASVNEVSPGILLGMLRQVSLDFYQHIATVKNVAPADFKSWIRRANRLGV